MADSITAQVYPIHCAGKHLIDTLMSGTKQSEFGIAIIFRGKLSSVAVAAMPLSSFVLKHLPMRLVIRFILTRKNGYSDPCQTASRKRSERARTEVTFVCLVVRWHCVVRLWSNIKPQLKLMDLQNQLCK